MNSTFLSFFLLFSLSNYAVAQITDSLAQKRPIYEIQDQQVLMQDSISALVQDSSLIVVKEKKDDYPNPKKAALLGLAIPGAGHIYNKRNWWWKVPIVYGGLVGGIWSIQYNQNRYNITRDVHCVKLINAGTSISEESRCFALILDPENPTSGGINEANLSNASRRNTNNIYTGLVVTDRYDVQSVKNLRDGFDKNLQLSWIGLVAGHLILNGAWSFVDAHLNDFDMTDDLSLKVKPSFQSIPLSQTAFVGTSVVLEF